MASRETRETQRLRLEEETRKLGSKSIMGKTGCTALDLEREKTCIQGVTGEIQRSLYVKRGLRCQPSFD